MSMSTYPKIFENNKKDIIKQMRRRVVMLKRNITLAAPTPPASPAPAYTAGTPRQQSDQSRLQRTLNRLNANQRTHSEL